MLQSFHATGELVDSKTVKLDQALPASCGKVRVTVEVLATKPKEDLQQFLERIWEGQRQRGHVPPTKEEVDAYLEAERASWDK